MQKLLESVNCNIIDTIDNKLVNENLFGMSASVNDFSSKVTMSYNSIRVNRQHAFTNL